MEQKMKHTPGPWTYGKVSPLVEKIGEDYVPDPSIGHSSDLRTEHNNFRITAWGHGLGKEETEANARLIASAPDLLKACQRYMEILRKHYGDMPVFMRPITNVIESAISKATGKH